jgi:hypothetical protein
MLKFSRDCFYTPRKAVLIFRQNQVQYTNRIHFVLFFRTIFFAPILKESQEIIKYCQYCSEKSVKFLRERERHTETFKNGKNHQK